MIYFNILMLLVCIVYVVDISGVMNSVNKAAYKALYGKEKHWDGVWYIPLISCSKCLSFWLILLYCMLADIVFIHSLFIACICSYTSGFVYRFFKYFEKWK